MWLRDNFHCLRRLQPPCHTDSCLCLNQVLHVWQPLWMSSSPYVKTHRRGVVTRVSIAVIKHCDQKQHPMKGFISLPHHSSPSKIVTAGAQRGKEPGGRRPCRSHREIALAGFLFYVVGLHKIAYYEQSGRVNLLGSLEISSVDKSSPKLFSLASGDF